MENLQKLTTIVKTIFRRDETRPSIVISKLKKNSFYMSIVRYIKSGKKVVCKSYGGDLDSALYSLVEEFAFIYPKNSALRKLFYNIIIK